MIHAAWTQRVSGGTRRWGHGHPCDHVATPASHRRRLPWAAGRAWASPRQPQWLIMLRLYQETIPRFSFIFFYLYYAASVNPVIQSNLTTCLIVVVVACSLACLMVLARFAALQRQASEKDGNQLWTLHSWCTVTNSFISGLEQIIFKWEHHAFLLCPCMVELCPIYNQNFAFCCVKMSVIC